MSPKLQGWVRFHCEIPSIFPSAPVARCTVPANLRACVTFASEACSSLQMHDNTDQRTLPDPT